MLIERNRHLVDSEVWAAMSNFGLVYTIQFENGKFSTAAWKCPIDANHQSIIRSMYDIEFLNLICKYDDLDKIDTPLGRILLGITEEEYEVIKENGELR